MSFPKKEGGIGVRLFLQTSSLTMIDYKLNLSHSQIQVYRGHRYNYKFYHFYWNLTMIQKIILAAILTGTTLNE